LLQTYFGRVTMEFKGDKNVVTAADRASEAMIKARLAEERPDDGLLAEEGTHVVPRNKRLWVVDPLDGTNNFAHGFWVYCISIALVENDRVVLGVVHAPELKQTFQAAPEGGAKLNGEAIQVSRIDRLERAICATGFPYDKRTRARNNLAESARVTLEVQGVRRVGAAALDLCWVAAGRWDGYWELTLNPWDVAAGTLICREAGGTVTGIDGQPYDIYQPAIVATNGLLHNELIALLNKA